MRILKTTTFAVAGFLALSVADFAQAQNERTQRNQNNSIFLDLNRVQSNDRANSNQPIFIQPNAPTQGRNPRLPNYDVIDRSGIQNNRGSQTEYQYDPSRVAREAIQRRNEYRRRRESALSDSININTISEQMAARYGNGAGLANLIDTTAFDAALSAVEQDLDGFTQAPQESPAETFGRQVEQLSQQATQELEQSQENAQGPNPQGQNNPNQNGTINPALPGFAIPNPNLNEL